MKWWERWEQWSGGAVGAVGAVERVSRTAGTEQLHTCAPICCVSRSCTPDYLLLTCLLALYLAYACLIRGLYLPRTSLWSDKASHPRAAHPSSTTRRAEAFSCEAQPIASSTKLPRCSKAVESAKDLWGQLA